MLPNQLITTQEIIDTAVAAAYEPASLRAILAVESSGHGFSTVTGRLIIRFEPTWFKRECKDWQTETSDFVWENAGSSNQTDEWTAFDSAFKEDPTAAMLSTSIGLPQIMGFHYADLGFTSVGSMWDFAKVSEANQVQMLVKFLKINPKLDQAMKTQNWDQFATYYNGAAYKQLAAASHTIPYDQQIANWRAHYLANPA